MTIQAILIFLGTFFIGQSIVKTEYKAIYGVILILLAIFIFRG